MMADLQLVGLDLVIPNGCWQDKFAISKDKKFIALISFDLSDNEPGFEIYIINTDKKTIAKTKRIFGLVNNISIIDRKIKFNKFLYDKTKSKTGELCCNIDDELDIE
ncbi:hypothetical protein [Telluribacter sp.]|jgi:hypothetical protein|uniref:hypothetical protein n=1 Tax=Telluribacter sp. TaxID=1978767 RepID=UPI002E15AF77|nr:hypothetical protein [Telluribacter sp.]